MRTALLLSGGMDSIALAFWKRPDLANTIDYGQRPFQGELRASVETARLLGISHEIIRTDCKALGSGDLSENECLENAPCPEWWPFRNQLLITLAGMKAVSLGIEELIFGAVSTDQIHADGRPQFFQQMNGLLGSQEGSLRVTVPGIEMTTQELIAASGVPKSILMLAHSCHKEDFACGRCRGCFKYLKVLEGLNNY